MKKGSARRKEGEEVTESEGVEEGSEGRGENEGRKK